MYHRSTAGRSTCKKSKIKGIEINGAMYKVPHKFEVEKHVKTDLGVDRNKIQSNSHTNCLGKLEFTTSVLILVMIYVNYYVIDSYCI